MDTSKFDDRDYWFYDVYLHGLDPDIWSRVSGSLQLGTGALKLFAGGGGNGTLETTTMISGGSTRVMMTVPHAPTAGDNTLWGFYSRAKGNVEAAYFFVSGTNFYARTYAADGQVQQTTILWDSSWTGVDALWEIRRWIDRVEFWVNNRRVAAHFQPFIPNFCLMPLYFSTAGPEASELSITYVEVRDARKMFFSKPNYQITTSTSTSSTSSTSTSSTTSTTTTSSSTSSTSSTSTTTSTTTTSSSTSSSTSTTTSTTTTTTSSSTSTSTTHT